uniref:3'-5' exonuclease domain-containing protein n=1 Tax=Tolypothrix bouteillei VB521301 TaxID=1479485 RepID=A0A0C1R3Z0_9CYAN
MFYLTQASDIQAIIPELTSHPILWLDTEVADYDTPSPKLSLIQVLAEANDLTGDSVYILDVLNKPDITKYFITQIMANDKIEKVFHNAVFDLKYLGSTQAENITCTYKIARSISRDRLGTSNLQLKTLAKELCHFTNVDAEEGRSDWGRRPLSPKQLEYAKMDTVYLAQVYFCLNQWLKSNGQLTLEYDNPDKFPRNPSLSEVYGEGSDRLNLPVEPEKFLNQIPETTSKSLKEKCQELIDLSQQKTELTKYAAQIDGFTGRQAKITNTVREILPLGCAGCEWCVARGEWQAFERVDAVLGRSRVSGVGGVREFAGEDAASGSHCQGGRTIRSVSGDKFDLCTEPGDGLDREIQSQERRD